MNPEDLAMTSEPKAPGAAAIFLYRQIDRNDSTGSETVYVRIKILKEEGRELGNVELSYFRGEAIRDIEARTIRPDGSVLNFQGTVYDRAVIKFREGRLSAKTFSLPSVEVGGILEYRYRHVFRHGFVFDSSWILSAGLFTRRAEFSLVPSRMFAMRWSWPIGRPPSMSPPRRDGRSIRLEVSDVPAFATEEMMPPENSLKYRVEFEYELTFEQDPDKYWRSVARGAHEEVERFVGRPRKLEPIVAQLIGPTDSPEQKLRKLYARAQQLRNLSFEREKSEQETRRERLADIRNAADALEHGYANATQITWVFLALARAAGFDADAVFVSTRDRYFFSPENMRASQLNSNIVRVKLQERELYLDPGIPYAPFGLLPWQATAVQGLVLDEEGKTWVTTPRRPADESRIQRSAVLRVTSDGGLTGRVKVTYTGLEAMGRRLLQRDEEEADRRESLEKELTRAIPSRAEAKLVNSPDWQGAEEPLVAEFDLTVSEWGSLAGKRALVPAGLFVTGERTLFEHSDRVHPIYVNFPFRREDDVELQLPAAWRVQSLPEPRETMPGPVAYRMKSMSHGASLHIHREFGMNLLLVRVDGYPALRSFMQAVRAGDGDTIVVEVGAK